MPINPVSPNSKTAPNNMQISPSCHLNLFFIVLAEYETPAILLYTKKIITKLIGAIKDDAIAMPELFVILSKRALSPLADIEINIDTQKANIRGKSIAKINTFPLSSFV